MKITSKFGIVSLAVLSAMPLGCNRGDNADQQAASTPPAAPAAGQQIPGQMAPRPVLPPGAGRRPTGPGGMRIAQGPKSGVFANGGPAQARPAQMLGGPGMPPGAPGSAVPAKAALTAGPPPGGINVDPFRVRWTRPTPPPYIFGEIQPIRLASDNVVTPPPPNTEVREVATRRVSGIMTGDGVYAILESNAGEPEIVKPGSETRDGYRVVSINSDSVRLQRKEGNLILTQVVPLTDAPVGGGQPAAFTPGGRQGFTPGGRGPGFGPGGGRGGKLGGGGAAGGGAAD